MVRPHTGRVDRLVANVRGGGAAVELCLVGADDAHGRAEPDRGGVPVVRAATVDDVVLAATGDYLVFHDPDDAIPPGAWAAMAAALEDSGSDLAVGDHRTPLPRTWAAELFAAPRRRATAATCPAALVDLALTNKMFRRDFWHSAGLRVGASTEPAAGDWSAGSGGAGCAAVLAAYLAAASFDVVPRVVCESPPRDTTLPVAEQARFRADHLTARLGRLDEALDLAPPGWRELAATHLLPPLHADAVGGGEPYVAALRAGSARLLDGLELAAVPVAARLGAYVAGHGSWLDQALLQDVLADNPHGLRAHEGLAPVPEGLSLEVPDAWRAIRDADRRPRCWAAERWVPDGDRLVLRGASFTEYVDEAPLPRVSLLVPGAAPVPLPVERRTDPRTNEWAGRAWEDRTSAGWSAYADVPLVAGSGSRTVEVRAGGTTTHHQVGDPAAGPRPPCQVDSVSLAAGVLSVGGGTDAFPVAVAVAGRRGAGPQAELVVTQGRFTGEVSLTASAFGQRTRLPQGRYQLNVSNRNGTAVTGAWAPGLLDDPPELVDDRQRVTLTAGLGLQVRPPLRAGERGAYAQQTLRSRAGAASRAPSYDRTVLLETFAGRSVGDNPGAIGRELLARNLGLDLVWVVDDPAVVVPDGTRAVHRRTAAWYDTMRNAHAYVANASAPYWFAKPPGQIHLQTWHGTPLKRIGEDRGPGDLATWRHRRRVEAQAARWDAMLSPSPYCSEIFASAFHFGGTFWETGYPRNDVLLSAEAGTVRERVRRRLGVTASDQVLLYAPTWRTHLGQQQSKPLLLDAERVTAECPDVVVLVRGHYSGTGEVEAFPDHPRVHDVTRHPDIAELYLAADVLVTDYSSVMFDFVLTDRPIILLTPDLEQYRDVERGFYLDLEREAPGPLTRSTSEVVAALHAPDDSGGRRAGFRARFCPWEDGRSAARAVDHLLDLW
ncbi:MAG TPA: CDP-glycerol glycerophosphotransferase family protein [Nocardioidaceae bacterium]|nr:CDP-glycerol glycerophosphotransferase family protein [Nocardioidaceae bacterium]